jgi:hypothetical protein
MQEGGVCCGDLGWLLTCIISWSVLLTFLLSLCDLVSLRFGTGAFR